MRKLISIILATMMIVGVSGIVLADEKPMTAQELQSIVKYLEIQKQSIVNNATTQINVMNLQIQQAKREIAALQPKAKPSPKKTEDDNF